MKIAPISNSPNVSNINKIFSKLLKGQEVHFEKGKALKKDSIPYSGVVSLKDKKGNHWEFIYQNGQIIQSSKNREIQKTYKYPPISTLDTEHVFQDGSKLVDGQFYNSQGLKTKQILYDGKTTEITLNKNAKYKNEPVIYIKKTQNDDEHTVQKRVLYFEEGEEKFEFKSLEEAREYFKTEYGIEAEFSNLVQAHITKEAIDDFAKLNINNSGKKIFSGLKITTEKTNSNEAATADIGIIYYWEKDKDFENFRKLFEENKTQEEKARYIIKHPPLGFRCQDFGIILNDNFDWNNSTRERMEKIGNSLSTSTLKGLIQHELGHILHGMNAPLEYTTTTLPDTKEKEKIRGEVSEYAKTNGAEFVAEYIAGRMSGKKYSQKANRLYKEYGGAEIFP